MEIEGISIEPADVLRIDFAHGARDAAVVIAEVVEVGEFGREFHVVDEFVGGEEFFRAFDGEDPIRGKRGRLLPASVFVRVNDAAGPPMPLALVVDLVPSGDAADRLPDPWPMVPILGVELPLLRLKIHEASAPIRLLLALGCHSLPATG